MTIFVRLNENVTVLWTLPTLKCQEAITHETAINTRHRLGMEVIFSWLSSAIEL